MKMHNCSVPQASARLFAQRKKIKSQPEIRKKDGKKEQSTQKKIFLSRSNKKFSSFFFLHRIVL